MVLNTSSLCRHDLGPQWEESMASTGKYWRFSDYASRGVNDRSIPGWVVGMTATVALVVAPGSLVCTCCFCPEVARFDQLRALVNNPGRFWTRFRIVLSCIVLAGVCGNH